MCSIPSTAKAQSTHKLLVWFHDQMKSVEPSVASEREEEQGSLVKLKRLVVLEEVIDVVDEGRLSRIEVLESLNGDET